MLVSGAFKNLEFIHLGVNRIIYVFLLIDILNRIM